MPAQHLLQENQVGAGAAYGFAQLRQDESAIERGKTLVGVHRQHANAVYGKGVCLMPLQGVAVWVGVHGRSLLVGSPYSDWAHRGEFNPIAAASAGPRAGPPTHRRGSTPAG